MKFSENWLRSHVPTTATRDELAATLTAIGLEVEGVKPLGESLDGVVVARIVECARHPEADKLQVCRVDAGDRGTCRSSAARRTRAGLVAPLATIGTKIGDMTIKAAKLRGVESSGMLCSAKELGLDADASGLLELPADAPVGAPLAEFLGLPDASFELKLTPNRADCFSVRGIAFDVAAACGSRVTALDATPMPALNEATLAIELNAGADAPRFVGRVIEGVDASVPTPAWMAERLRRSGVRPVSFLVDVTQYVMLELGQPMHAYDRDLLDGAGVGARRATAKRWGCSTATKPRSIRASWSSPTPAARSGSPASWAGTRKVGDATRNVFLEAAHFAPSAIIGRGRKLGLHTDAAHRFERGVDPELPRIAIEQATRLVVEIAGGAPRPGGRGGVARTPAAAAADPPAPRTPRARARRARGRCRSRAHPVRAWPRRRSGRRWLGRDCAGAALRPRDRGRPDRGSRAHPRLRRDPGDPARFRRAPDGAEDPRGRGRRAPATGARDYLEAVNYAFVDAALLAQWQAGGGVPLANPLSADLGVMRPSLLPGAGRRARAQRRAPATARALVRTGQGVRMREPGTGDRERTSRLRAKFRASPRSPAAARRAEQWGETAREVDFHDLKGRPRQPRRARPHPAGLSPDRAGLGPPGRSAQVLRDGRSLGWIGQLHPRLQQALGAGRGGGRVRTRSRPVAGTRRPRRHGAVALSVCPPRPRVRRRRRRAVGRPGRDRAPRRGPGWPEATSAVRPLPGSGASKPASKASLWA